MDLKNIETIFNLIFAFVAIMQTRQLIKINKSMKRISEKQYTATEISGKLEQYNKESLNVLVNTQNDFWKLQNEYLNAMRMLQKEKADFEMNEINHEKEKAKPNLWIAAYAYVVPVKYQLDSREIGKDHFVKKISADYRIILYVRCINLSTMPIAIESIGLDINGYKSGKNLYFRPSGAALIPYYLLNNTNIITLMPGKQLPITLSNNEAYSSDIFYECIGKPKEGTAKVIIWSGEKHFEKEVLLTFHEGITSPNIAKITERHHKETEEYYKEKRYGKLENIHEDNA